MPDHASGYGFTEVHDDFVVSTVIADDNRDAIRSDITATRSDIANLSTGLSGQHTTISGDLAVVSSQVADVNSLVITETNSIQTALTDLSRQLGDPRPAEPSVYVSLLNNFNTVLASLSSLLTAVSVPGGALSTQIATHDSHVYDHVTTAIGDTLAVGTALAAAEAAILASLSGDVANLQAEHAAITADLATLLARPAARLPALPTHTVIAEHDWSQSDTWSQPADFYLVTVTAWPASQGEQPSGVVRLPHLGWCAIVGPAGAASRLEQIDYVSRVVTSPDVAPQGLILWAKPGTVGHVQACRNA